MTKLIKSLCAATALAGTLSFAPAAFAQAPSAEQMQQQMAMAYQAARAQLGIMGYCVDKGHIGADLIDIQKKLVGMIPPPADKAAGDAAEAQGRKGTFALGGASQDIEAIAKAQNSTPAAFCKQIGDAVQKAGAVLPK